ncbi:MAG: tetratricopeptide repeat protein [Lautropia sp.]
MKAAGRRVDRRWRHALAFTAGLLAFAWLLGVRDRAPSERVPAFVPADSTAVLERLPRRLVASPGRDGNASPNALNADVPEPTDARREADAVALARRHVAASRAWGDPRELGYAQAALSRWWNDAEPPVDVALVRAVIHSQQHDFDAALADLRSVTRREPGNVQGWLSRASIEQTTGRLDDARQSCRHLVTLPAAFVGRVCLEDLASLTGDRAAFDRLKAVLQGAAIRQAERGWAHGVLAEMAERLDRPDDAERAFAVALIDDAGTYARTAFADFLMRDARWADAARILEGAPATDAVLLRRAIALRALGDARAAALGDELRARFADERLRGGAVHLREMARFALEFEHAPETALADAQRNWSHQKEPADLLLLIAAARAAGRPSAAADGERFIARYGIVDARLDDARGGAR